MTSIVSPTVLAQEPHEFREQMMRIQGFAKRIQIDLMDGDFAPTTSVALDRIWWDETIQADIHLMYRQPLAYLAQLILMKPHLVIWHAESEAPHEHMVREFHKHGIKAGLAVLADTSIGSVKESLPLFDHLLIFSGELGKFGGQANLDLLSKVGEARQLRPDIEIGWDGGINSENAATLVRGGIDVLNVGGAIQRASNPESAYATLEALVEANIK